MYAAPATALEWTEGEWRGSIDTTISFGTTYRTESRDRRLIGIANGGSAFSVNGDDGNLNYGKGFTSAAAKVNHEVELRWKEDWGLFARGFYFYDFITSRRNGTDRSALTDAAIDGVGRQAQLLDLYVFGKWDSFGLPTTLRAGNQVLSWGESTFIPNGINIINPVDISKIRVPGAELKEALTPVPMISGTLGLFEGVSLEGFYQLDQVETELEPLGTMFSTNDFLSPGANRVYLGFGQIFPGFSDQASYPGLSVGRQGDRTARNANQFGVAGRFFLPFLDDAEFALFFINHHSRSPITSARTGAPPTTANPQAAQAQYVASAGYYAEYPENIRLFGASFNAGLPFGISMQGEYALRNDQPLQVDDVELLFASLSPINAAFAQGQLGRFGFNQDVRGYIRRDVSTAQFTLTKAFSQVLGGDQLALIGEAGLAYVHDMPDKSRLRLEGPGTYTGGNPFYTSSRLQPATTPTGQFADAFSWGYRLVARLTYNNVFDGVNLIPSLAFQHDVDGTTPAPVSRFVDGRMAVTTGLTATYLGGWAADIGWTTFFGGGANNLLRDRDFVAATVRYSF